MRHFIILFGFLGDWTPSIEDPFEKISLSTIFFKDLHLLYFYFSSYPYVFGILTDEEISQIFTTFKSILGKNELWSNIISSFNSLMDIVSSLAHKIDNGMSILKDTDALKNLHKLLITFNCSVDQLYQGISFDGMRYYQVKYYFSDIDFCVSLFLFNIFKYNSKNPLISEFISCIYSDKRVYKYIMYLLHLKKDNKIPDNEQEKIFNKSIKYNDTIIIGDEKFLDLMKKINLPCKNKYYLNEKEIENFFKEPKKIDNKYKVCKYIIIMNEKIGIEYLETIRYLSNIYVFKMIIILYIQNKNIKINKKILQFSLIPVILTFNEKDILNYYNDHFEKLREKNIKYIERNELLDKQFGTDIKFHKIEETKIIKEEDNGWDMKKDIDSSIFNIVKVERVFEYTRIDIYKKNV